MEKNWGFAKVFFTTFFLVTTALPALSLADDLVDRARQLRELAVQKREAETRQGLAEALRLSKISPVRAAEHLKPILGDLEGDTQIPSAKKESLARLLQNQIRQYENDAKRGNSRNENSIQVQAEAQGRQTALDAKTRDAEALARSLDGIRNLRKDKNFDEANRRYAELARKYPDNSAVRAMGAIGRTQANIDAESNLRAQRGDMTLALQREVLRSSIPISGEITFPDDWVERSKRRLPSAKISEEDKKILKSMSSPMTLTLKNEPFQGFLDYMEKQFGQPFILDQQALQLANVNGDTQVSLNARNWSSRTVLRKVLSDLGLAYVVKEKSIHITTPDRAKETMTTRAYPVGDILGMVNYQLPAFYNQLPWQTQLEAMQYNQLRFMQNVQNIINSIKAIDPQSWQPEGNGSIVFEPGTMSLIIRQPAEFHFMIGSGIR